MSNLNCIITSLLFAAPNREESNIDTFNQMMQDVDTGNAAQAELAKQALEAIILGPPTTIPPIPTRTGDGDTETTEEVKVVTSASTTEGSTSLAEECKKEADDQLSKQTAMESMLVQNHVIGSEWPSEVENRLALSVVAASILGGESDNVNKWECVGEIYPEKEGAPKSLREMEWYMLDYVGSVNVSADDTLCGKLGDEYQKGGKKCPENSVFYDDTTQGMHFYTGGQDFGE